MGKQFDNFLIGSAIWAGLALVFSLFFTFYAGAVTKDPSMKKANMCMGCGLTWLGVFYMWIAWSTFY